MIDKAEILQDILAAHVYDVELIKTNLENCEQYLFSMKLALKSANALPFRVVPLLSSEQLEAPKAYLHKLGRLLGLNQAVGTDNSGARRALKFSKGH